MTTVDVVYRYGLRPSEATVLALARVREVYGVRAVDLREREGTVRVEYDSTRLTEQIIHQLLRRSGLDVREKVTLYTVTPPPAQPVQA